MEARLAGVFLNLTAKLFDVLSTTVFMIMNARAKRDKT